MFRVMMLVGFCGCASIPADARRGGACPELAVEVDRVMPTRRVGAEARSQSTRMWVDARDVPHVTWSSQWWRFTTMGRSHRELHHAWLAGRRWIVEHDPVPSDWPANPDIFAHDGSRWYVQSTDVDSSPVPRSLVTRLWVGPPWRVIHTIREGEFVLTQRQDRDGAWLVTTMESTPSSPGGEAPIRRYRFTAGQLAEVVDLDEAPAPDEVGSTRPTPDVQWPAEVSRAPSYDSFAVATRDGRTVIAGVGWRPRGPATQQEHPHGEPYVHYPNPRRGRGTLMVWVLEGSQAEPRVVHSVRLRRHLRPQVELGPGGAIHVLLVDTYVSDFAPNRYVKLRCRSLGS